MLRVLLKKQLAEVFRSYFYNAKKNKMRSKWAIAGWFVFFVVVMVGMLGGIFTFLSLTLCRGMLNAGMGWLYFLLMSLIAVALGTFGSVFNTYAGLYLSKDNDLLLSMPIPVSTIITARLANVYLMGAMYSATVLLPMLIVYWVIAGVTAARVICGVALFAIITFIVLMLSCALGWVVAKLSLKLRNKSFVTVIVSLLFIGGYYFFYFKARDILRDILLNAMTYGAQIKGSAYGAYLFGRIGEGDWTATAIFFAVTAALFALVWIMLTRSFLSVATASEKRGKARYTGKPVRQRSPFAALLGKEFSRFTASANYMMNCGFGMVLLLAGGVLALFKGREVCDVIDKALADRQGATAVIFCAVLCLIAAMNDMAAPSVSLEGKSLWIGQSLPVKPGKILRAKACAHLILTGVPLLFASICVAAVLGASAAVRLLAVALPLAYAVFSALFDTAVGVSIPILNWTNEVAPIKQSGAVVIALFVGWLIVVAFGALYLLFGYRLGAAAYLTAWTAAFAVASLGLLRWLDTRGARAYARL